MFSLHFSIATLFPFLLFNLKVLNPAGSLVRDCSQHDEIFRCEMKFGKKMNMSDDLLISFLSYDEVSAFLLLLKARNSSLLTGRLIFIVFLEVCTYTA